VLVHRLKYSAFAGAAEPLAVAMAGLLPGDATAVIPVPRVTARRWAYGVDPALELARRISRRSGIPLIQALVPRAWVRHRAGPAGRRRGTPGFSLTGSAPAGAVLIDDVVTSGVTISRAGAVSNLTRAVTATAGFRP
jgi:predicted amidophosphoribosyltransferase